MLDKINVRKIPSTHSGKRMSDHRFLKIHFKFTNNKRGQGYWKLNTSYCNNEDYTIGIRNIIYTLDTSLNAIERWELLKRNIKEYSMDYAKLRQKSIRQNIKSIEKELDDLETGPSEKFDYAKIKLLETKLDSLYDHKIKGAQIRSKAKWIENGEKNSKYFLNLEKQHQSLNVIRELKQSNGEIVNKTNSLLGEMVAFYTNLYKSKDISNENVDRYLENIDVPEIKNDDKHILNKFPSYSECSEAVFQMKNNKSPGIDGLPSEFYQCFWTELGPIFFAALKEIFEQGELTNSQQ